MSQFYVLPVGGGGGGLVETLTGDIGHATASGNNINVITGLSTNNSGATFEFTGSGSTLTLNTNDSNGNLAFGKGAGSALSGSNNLYIYNAGGTESNIIRIGTQGSGSGQQNQAFVAGIFGNSPSSSQMVIVNSSGQLGSQTIPSAVSLTYTNVNTSPYVVLSTDQYLSVDCSGGPITLQFPNAATSGRTYIVKDRTGNAATNNITLESVSGSVNIDGATTFVMNTNYEAANLMGNSSTYEVF